MNPQARLIADIYESEKPDLWRKCLPRNYSGVGHYESPRYVAAIIASSIEWICGEIAGQAPLTARHIAMATSSAFENNLPAFFVTKEFLLAVSNTDLPDDIKWTDAKLPFESGLLYLPKKTLFDPEGDSVTVLGWTRNQKGSEIKIGEKIKVACVDDTFIVFAICDSDIERLYSSAVRADEMPYIKWKTGDTKPASPFDLPLTNDDKTFLHQLVCVVFSLLLAQVSKPTLTTEGRRETDHKKQKRETWTPNYLGKGYTIKRQHQGGTHASPNLHWRKGHYTHSVIGDYRNNPDFISTSDLPRFEDGRINWEIVDDRTRKKFWRNHKHQWIEPILIEGNGQ